MKVLCNSNLRVIFVQDIYGQYLKNGSSNHGWKNSTIGKKKTYNTAALMRPIVQVTTRQVSVSVG